MTLPKQMSNHTVRFGPVCCCSTSYLFLYFPSTAFLLYCHVLLQVGKPCYDCLREGDDKLITAGNHLVASSTKPWHVGCALRRRREMVETITLESDERAAANSAEKSRNASRGATPAKRPRESLARGEQLDLS